MAMCMVSSNDGDTCAAPYGVTSSGYSLSVADITTFADNIDLNGTMGCVDTSGGMSSEFVLEINLTDGQELAVERKSGAFVTYNLQSGTCGDLNDCVSSLDTAFGRTVVHTATGNETIYVIVDSWATSPVPNDFDLRISIDAVCGNGLLEINEDCDDGNITPNDGCSNTCRLEYLHRCDGLSPSGCPRIPDIGTFAPGDTIAPITKQDPAAMDDADAYSITLTEPARVTIDAVATAQVIRTSWCLRPLSR